MRYAARKDETHAAIVQALRDHGAYLWDIGLPVDILCGYKNTTVLMELKSGSKKKLTKLQQDFFRNWTGGILARVDSVEAALRILKTIDAMEEDK